MGFTKQEYWSVLPYSPSEHLLNLGIKLASPTLTGRFFITSVTWETHVHIYVLIYTHTHTHRAYTNICIYIHTQKEKYVYVYIYSNFQLHRRWVPWAPKLFKGQLCIHVSNHYMVHLKHVCYVNCISIKWGQKEVVAILESTVSSSIFLFTLHHNVHTHVHLCIYNQMHTHIHSQIHIHRLKQNKK